MDRTPYQIVCDALRATAPAAGRADSTPAANDAYRIARDADGLLEDDQPEEAAAEAHRALRVRDGKE